MGLAALEGIGQPLVVGRGGRAAGKGVGVADSVPSGSELTSRPGLERAASRLSAASRTGETPRHSKPTLCCARFRTLVTQCPIGAGIVQEAMIQQFPEGVHMAGQIIDIQATWGGTRFHCPACGAEIFDDGGVTHRACNHLLFTWVSETGEMDYVSPTLPENLRRVGSEQGEDAEEGPNPSDPAYAKLLGNGDVVFCLLAPAPGCLIIAIGIRFPE